MEIGEYFIKNYKRIFGISILIQVGLSILILMNNFTQENAERLLMIYISIGLPNWASIFLTGITEILFFILTGIIMFYFEEK